MEGQRDGGTEEGREGGLLCRTGAMVLVGLKVRLTLEQIPVLYRELPHSWDQRGPQV